ncbi:hypothetical protein SGGMMB4_01137 [Sodalis glossinidius str. 'morsitans']|uniref:Uncharacterized protein n=1 Tax=Sodalis glossinidius (strain morsitans) TaxID=343509 RepID=Q2NVR9_SODGM|nr:hypothetical protein [Sodalis glossinidius]BAE73756.1 hypothetical protein SG0481 [Sodalis glossinidius str. 'morsitans']CRL44187.1 hypothetical protein SGGMMB4_01137 [Sodalis glossinidius str. 'morsitans']
MIAVESVAVQSVEEGSPCQEEVASAFGIDRRDALIALELLAVNGPAGEGVKEGQSCRSIGESYGIDLPEEQLELQLLAVEGASGHRARQGDSCRVIAEECAISDAQAAFALEMISVKSAAADRVIKGESCRAVADALGITKTNAVRIAVDNGPAGEKVAQGLPWQTISRECGLSDDEAVFALANKRKDAAPQRVDVFIWCMVQVWENRGLSQETIRAMLNTIEPLLRAKFNKTDGHASRYDVKLALA